MEYRLANYLLNTHPRLLTFGAYELYKRGYEPKQKTPTNKVSEKKILGLIKTVLKNINKGKLDVIKNKLFYQLLTDIIDESYLVGFATEIIGNNYEPAIYKLSAVLEDINDSTYENKFEYLRVKIAEQ